jgi:hypothetical protein
MQSTYLRSRSGAAISSKLSAIHLISFVWPSPCIASILGFAAQFEDLETGGLIAGQRRDWA